MEVPISTAELLTTDGVPLKQSLKKAERKNKIRAFLLVFPLLLFIIVTFVMPIGDMLLRSVDEVFASGQSGSWEIRQMPYSNQRIEYYSQFVDESEIEEIVHIEDMTTQEQETSSSLISAPLSDHHCGSLTIETFKRSGVLGI